MDCVKTVKNTKTKFSGFGFIRVDEGMLLRTMKLNILCLHIVDN